MKRKVYKLENEPNLTLKNLGEDFQRFISVRQDAYDIELNDVSHMWKVHKNKVKKKNTIPNPCYACGKLHFYNNCPYKNKGFFVTKKGHKKTHSKIKIKTSE